MDDNLFGLNNPSFINIVLRFIINLIFLYFLIKVIYYRYSRKERFFFTFFILGIVTFFVACLLRSVYVEMAMAVGLFTIFSILRFRTRNVCMKDMAYIFTTIAVSVISSLILKTFPAGVLIINAIIILSVYLLEEFIQRHKLTTHSIVYDNLELLRPEKKHRLIKDISERTGQDVVRVRIRRIDLRRKSAVLEVYCKA